MHVYELEWTITAGTKIRDAISTTQKLKKIECSNWFRIAGKMPYFGKHLITTANIFTMMF